MSTEAILAAASRLSKAITRPVARVVPLRLCIVHLHSTVWSRLCVTSTTASAVSQAGITCTDNCFSSALDSSACSMSRLSIHEVCEHPAILRIELSSAGGFGHSTLCRARGLPVERMASGQTPRSPPITSQATMPG